MNYQSTTLQQPKLNLFYLSGPFERADLVNTFKLEGYEPEFDDLAVCAADTNFAGVDFDTVKEHAHRLVRGAAQAGVGKRRALVTANAMQGVLGRMFLSFLRSKAPPNFEIECFDNLPTAVAWIAARRSAFEPVLDRSLVLRALESLERRTGSFDPGTASSGGR